MLLSSRIALALGGAIVVAGAAAAAPPPAVYVAKAGASDLYERQASQLVLAGTHNAGVRRFATMMVHDHTDSTAKVKAAAMRAGLHPRPPALEPKQAQMIAELRRARGPERDRVYVEQQKAAHQEALALHQDFSTTGDAPPLRAVAAQVVPVVQHHIEMLNAMPG